MNRFLSHDQTKADLTEYLADKILEYNKHSPKLVITSAAGHTRSNKDVGLFSENNHEEADTLMICLGVDATKRNSMDSKMTFFSPDTEDFNLHDIWYPRDKANMERSGTG